MAWNVREGCGERRARSRLRRRVAPGAGGWSAARRGRPPLWCTRHGLPVRPGFLIGANLIFVGTVIAYKRMTSLKWQHPSRNVSWVLPLFSCGVPLLSRRYGWIFGAAILANLWLYRHWYLPLLRDAFSDEPPPQMLIFSDDEPDEEQVAVRLYD